MNKAKKILIIVALFFSVVMLAGCDQIIIPSDGDDTNRPGSNGEYNEQDTLLQIYRLAVSQGYDGEYEEWIESLKGDSVEFRVSDGTIQWRYSSSGSWNILYEIDALKGEQGADGAAGEDGKDGKDGKDGVDGTDGTDGLTPYIGKNGHWWIGDVDTKVKANGKDGIDGINGTDGLTPYIGKNGNWWIGEKDTKVKAEGKGAPGKSAYEAFKELHPEYTGDEAQWVSDLINGKLFEINYEYFTVKFDDGSGNILSEESVMSSRPANKPEDPVKKGYIFAGWYANGEKWNFDSNVVLKDITLVANWVKSNQEPNIKISDVRTDTKNIYFEINEDNFCVIESIALYLEGKQLVESLDNLSKREFNNVYSNKYYQIVVTYSYDMNDGLGKQTASISKDCFTRSMNIPSYSVSYNENSYNSISFNIYENDYDNIGEVSKVEVYLNDQYIKELNQSTTYQIDGLLAGTVYKVVIYYSYDMNDGTEMITEKSEFDIGTKAVVKPDVKFKNMDSTQNKITGEIVITDPSKIGELVAVRLYQGETLISESKNLSLNYTNLDSNSEYEISVAYKYDLYDGEGEKIYYTNEKISTHPYYELISTRVLNPTTIVEGDTIYLYADVNNPSKAKFKYVYVNGERYEVNSSSTSTKIYASLHGFEEGRHKLVIEKMIAEINDNQFEVYAQEYNSVSIKVNKGLIIDSIEMVDDSLTKKNYYIENEDIYVKINVNNPAGYSLETLEVSSNESNYYNNETFIYDKDEITKIDNDTYLIKYKGNMNLYSNHQLYIKSYTYKGTDFTKEMTIKVYANNICMLDNEVVEISTVEDLLNTDFSNYKYYKLMNDIDLTGINWEPIQEIAGVFDGNGYSIKNMQIVGTYQTSINVYFGFANNLNGTMMNLTFESAVVMLTLKDYYSDSNNNNISIIFAQDYSNLSSIVNCHIDENSSLSVETDRSVHVGAFIGYSGGSSSSIKIYDSSNKANISVTPLSTTYDISLNVGAFSGYSLSEVYNSFNTGNIINNNRGGSIFAAYISNETKIINSYNTGSYNNNYGLSLNKNEELDRKYGSYSFKDEYQNEIIDWTEKTYSFETCGASEIESINAIVLTELPEIQFGDYYFLGWYDNPEYLGNAIVGPYFSIEDCVLYARWGYAESDIKQFVENSSLYPFTESNGNIVSSNHMYIEGEMTSVYRIIANKKIRVYFNVEVKNANENTYVTGRTTNAYGEDNYIYYYMNNISIKYIDLFVGDYIEFRSYGEAIVTIQDLAICITE